MDNAGFTPGALPYAQRRRHSFSSVYSPSVQIHPLLNAENPFGNFVFDLASPVPNPLVYYREVPGALSPEGLAQPVTYPPITRMRITSDTLPQEWDVILDLSPELYEYNFRAGYDPPPITVQDVFQELHRHMQSQISHSDWAKLSPRGMEKVRLAFVRRCEAAPGGPDAYDRERAQGVRRVDYLSGKTRFVGLLKTGKEDTFKLITTDPPTA
ncbi:hypothetical protein C0993_003536 [Termitomyces sp. T159_Od127]|nr:hypothetical protein C0993_003536 [Termitomyces sp. T159_Od127]